MSGSASTGKDNSFHAIPPKIIRNCCPFIFTVTEILHYILYCYGKKSRRETGKKPRKQRGNAEEDRNLKRDRDLEKEKVESLYVTREMAEDKKWMKKIRQDLIHAADQEKEFQKEASALPA